MYFGGFGWPKTKKSESIMGILGGKGILIFIK